MLGGAGGADRLQAELRAASRYGTGAAPQPSRALALPAKISAWVRYNGATWGLWSNRASSLTTGTEIRGVPLEEAQEASAVWIWGPVA